jgi:glycosyltransferase involved in cell wall biosynthesis
MMGICHIISGDLWAGAEVLVFNLIRELNRSEAIKLSVVLLNEGRLSFELRALGVDCRVIPEGNRNFISLLFELRSLFRSIAPYIIHSHRYKENILAFLASRGIEGSRLVATQHGMPEKGHGKFDRYAMFVSWINRYLLARRFDFFVGVSKDIRERFVDDHSFRPERSRMIHNGIALPEIGARKQALQLVIGSAGRLFAVKDYPLLVAAAQIAVSRNSNFRFELAGEGPERNSLEQLIVKKGIAGAFKLRGQLEDMRSFYAGIDVYINTSVHEGIPMSILEAMANGVPVIAPRVGGIMEIIDNEIDGFLISTRNPEDFAERCLRLQDPELRRRMGAAARKKIERHFSAEKMARDYLKLYHELVH